MNKTCMFQYWANNRMIEDTELITEEEAQKLFDKYSADFKADLEAGEEPALAWWVNNTEHRQYQDARYSWHADDFKIIDGCLYQRV